MFRMRVSNYNKRTTVPERTAAQALGGGGLNAFHWDQLLALDLAIVEAQNVKLILRLPNCCNVSSWRKNLIKLTPYDETKKRVTTHR